MRIIILGAGAVGGIVGGYLARAGREVVLLARGEHAEAIRARGLRVEAPDEAFVVRPPTEPGAWREGDVVVLATKTQDAAAALDGLAPPPHVPIACLTNGVECERIALRRAARVYGACVMMPATFQTPGVVQVGVAAPPGAFVVGAYPHGSDGDEAATALALELRAAGFDVDVQADVMRWKRAKLLTNLANAIEAFCGAGHRDSPLADELRSEGRACFAAAGLAYASAEEDQQLRARLRVGTALRAQRLGGSTWQSLARGRGLETDYLNGEIALLGRVHGVPTPRNAALQRFAAAAARSGARAGAMTLAELVEAMREPS